jgi:hypothetical protein
MNFDDTPKSCRDDQGDQEIHMQDQNARLQVVAEPAVGRSKATTYDTPVREYICALATELA